MTSDQLDRYWVLWNERRDAQQTGGVFEHDAELLELSVLLVAHNAELADA